MIQIQELIKHFVLGIASLIICGITMADIKNTKDFMKTIPELTVNVKRKKVKPKWMAVVDEDNCTGCQVCVPFCPVDCIEPVPQEKYKIPIPPVQVR